MKPSPVVSFADAVTRREQQKEHAQTLYFEMLAKQLGYASFEALSAEHDACFELELEEMSQKLGFSSFDAFVEHEQRGVS